MAYKYRLSPTALNLLDDCERCFWLENVKRLPRPRGIFPSLPNGVDRILKNHFDRCTIKGELPPELGKEGVDAKLYEDLSQLEKWRDARKGIEWTDESTGVYLHGGVDAMLERKGKLIVLDFKTRGYALKADTAHYYADQLNCYNFLLRKNGHATEDYSYLLFFIPEKVLPSGEFAFDTKLVKMPVDVRRVEDMLARAVKVLEGPEPQPANDCEYCTFVATRNNPPATRPEPAARRRGGGKLEDFV
ncbi:MAG: PD-(D/E)XK nuclease family protein [Candidatus Micrarchaeota archaeon]